MKLRTLWERYMAQRRALTAALPPLLEARTSKPFTPLTREESTAILDEAIRWLMDEARSTLAMPNGPSNERRRAELRARYRSVTRDYLRLAKEQES